MPDTLSHLPPASPDDIRALTIPCGFSHAEGMPLSLQIAAAPFREATALKIAHAYQQATDWHRRHPDLA
jgi:Asp-tRNA(Asn)/Glu-tRNA(Gln) amidotransferase A subunit family amidase